MIPKKQSLDSISYKKDKGKFSFSLIGSIVLLRYSTIIKMNRPVFARDSIT